MDQMNNRINRYDFFLFLYFFFFFFYPPLHSHPFGCTPGVRPLRLILLLC